MSKFSPAEVDAFLEAGAPRTVSDDIPADFFENFERQVLEAVSAETTDTNVVSMQPRGTRRRWWYVAVAAVFLIVCGVGVRHIRSVAATIECNNDIYAVTDEMTDEEIDDLDEMFQADVFLEEL